MNKRNTRAFRKNAAKRMNRPERMEAVNDGFLKLQALFFGRMFASI